MAILDPPREKIPQNAAPNNDCSSRHVSRVQDANPLSLSYLISLGRRQLRTIVAITLTVGVLLTTFALMRETRFTATTLLVVDRSNLDLDRGNLDRVPPQHVDTEVEILRSMNIVKRLAERLHLVAEPKNPDPAPSVIGNVARSMHLVLNVAMEAPGHAPTLGGAEMIQRISTGFGLVGESHGPALATAIAKESEVEDNSSALITSKQLFALASKFRIRRRGLTDVIAIDASAKTPQRAAKLANLYAELYLEAQVSAKLYSIERVEAALLQRIDELKAELAKAGAAMEVRQLYNDYLSRLKEVRQKRGVNMPDLRIAAPALPLDKRSFPSTRLLVLLGWLVAFGLAVSVAFLLDRSFVTSVVTDGDNKIS